MGCRFPDADDPAALLDLVLTGRRTFRRLPPGRLDLADYYSADRAAPDATYSARAAVLEGWQFDLAAFGVPAAVLPGRRPRALARAGDHGARAGRPRASPQARAWPAAAPGSSSATPSPETRPAPPRCGCAGRTSGGCWPRRSPRATSRGSARCRCCGTRRSATWPRSPPRPTRPWPGATPASIAARICGYFGFRGGGYAVDGSQASSLLAVASACTALAAGDLDVALAGGVDISLDPLELVGLAKTGALARGDMRVYDENPTGFLPGEGCGMVVLMRSADARLAGLPVYAEIAGWGTSSAGQASIAVPGRPQPAPGPAPGLPAGPDRAGRRPADRGARRGHRSRRHHRALRPGRTARRARGRSPRSARSRPTSATPRRPRARPA